MNPSFRLINDLDDFLAQLDARWFVSGGWAINVHLGRITRERGDLDISVPAYARLETIQFFLEKGWQIEGKRGDGFKTIQHLSDYEDAIHYFWSFAKGVDFIGEYMDERGNRRISYNRRTQHELDYIEVFFDRIEEGHFIYRRDSQVKRAQEQAILAREGIRYLAPELVLLYKSNSLSEKDMRDFEAVVGGLHQEAITWLKNALLLIYGDSHTWLARVQES